MHITILYNAVSANPSPDERDVLVQVEAVGDALKRLGHSVSEVACTLDIGSLVKELEQTRPDVVFNLVEGLGGTDRLQPLVPLLLEQFGIRYTGCSSAAIALTNDKVRCKNQLQEFGLPAPGCIEAGGERSSRFETPKRYIIKTAGEHASWGLDDDAVVSISSTEDLRQIVAERSARWNKPCFAEEFIAGREFNLSMLAGERVPEVLPCAEISFEAFPAGKPHIVGYRAKWEDESFEAVNTPRTFEFTPADNELLAELRRLALACWTVCGLSGYARVDFRVDEAGRPWILEINGNACLSPDAGFAAAVAHAGLMFDDAIERIVSAALPGGTSLRLREERGKFVEDTPSADSGRGTSIKMRTEVNPADRERVRQIVGSTGFFSPAEVDVAVELVDERLSKGDASGYFFLFTERDGETVGYACYGPIACTTHSFDLYWIAVDRRFQGLGIGRQLLTAAEKMIKAAGGRRIYVETSSRADYHSTRSFYEHTGYVLDARVIDFYGPKDDKCLYVKLACDDAI